MNERVKIKIYGFNLKHVVNYLVENGVLVNDLKIKSKYMIFVIYLKDKLILDKYCKIYHKEYQIVKIFSFKDYIKNIRFYFGGIFAFVLIVCYILSFNFMIFDIKIINDSNNYYDLEKVNNILKSNNINSGNYIYSSSKIENIILNNLSDLAGCSVELIGGKLNVSIMPEIKNETQNKKCLISKYDAVITNIDVFSGNGKFKVGDIVKKDDKLVDSLTNAEAKVYGNVYFSSSLLHNKNKQNIKYTGKYLVNKSYYLFNKILFNHENDINFSNYLTKKCVFYIMENYLFPIKCESEYFFEYEIQEDVVEFEMVENDLKEKLYAEICLTIPKDAKILNTYYSVVKEGDLTRLDCFVEANVSLI